MPAATPEQQFIAAMKTSGVVPQLASPSTVVKLGLAVCAAYGSGMCLPQIMAKMASA